MNVRVCACACVREELIKSLCYGSICRRLVVMAAVPVRRTSVLDLPRVLLPAADVLWNIWRRCAAYVLCGHKACNESQRFSDTDGGSVTSCSPYMCSHV